MARRWAEYRVRAFWARVARSGSSDCWNWTGALGQSRKNPTPYGVLGFEGRHERAHRVAYRLAVGPIAAGRFVLHRCDNTLCCNPAHLYLGDHPRNMQDMVERGRRRGKGAGEENGRAKLSARQARRIREVYAGGGRSQQSIADEFGLSQVAVSAIVRGRRYAEFSTHG